MEQYPRASKRSLKVIKKTSKNVQYMYVGVDWHSVRIVRENLSLKVEANEWSLVAPHQFSDETRSKSCRTARYMYRTYTKFSML